MNSNVFKAFRLHLGMTQKTFAELIGVSATTVAFIETGQRSISPLTKSKLAKTLEISDEFLTFVENLNRINHFNNSAMDSGGQAKNENR
ncbi:helix-turn-helix domain-containing protein [Priestia flexa]|uniref:helix-turn-helix domain-containing protein n=1 Tax=Priestia flexa TaxID=86664 RepID=UPI00099D6F78|nr:helix-turn-helix transcriptional regulator [Priestia flexa]AQX53351.1 hypothetical protein BC359_02880 [Priestia flexa]